MFLGYCEGPGGVLGKVVNIPHEVVLVTHVLSLGLPTSSEHLTQEGYTEGGGREERRGKRKRREGGRKKRKGRRKRRGRREGEEE